MVAQFLSWSVALFSSLIEWLNSMYIVQGVSLLAFLVAVFVIGLVLRALITH